MPVYLPVACWLVHKIKCCRRTAHKGFEGHPRYNAIEPTNGWRKNNVLLCWCCWCCCSGSCSLYLIGECEMPERKNGDSLKMLLFTYSFSWQLCLFIYTNETFTHCWSDVFWFSSSYVWCAASDHSLFAYRFDYMHIHPLSFYVIFVCTCQGKNESKKYIKQDLTVCTQSRIHMFTHVWIFKTICKLLASLQKKMYIYWIDIGVLTKFILLNGKSTVNWSI